MKKHYAFTQFRFVTERAGTLAVCLTLCALGMGLPANAQNHHGATIVTFDPPGSTFTVALDINPAGVTTGFYEDASGVSHGFLRAPDGTFTTFGPPGSVITLPASINAVGAITGWYEDANFVEHGFLRIPEHSEEN